MKKLTKTNIQDQMFLEALLNVIQRGTRSIKEQYNDIEETTRTENKLPLLKVQRILMEKLYYALMYDRAEIKVILKKIS